MAREPWHSIPGASVFLIPPLDRWPLHSCRQSIHPCSFQVAISTNLASPLPWHCTAGGMPVLSHSPKQTYGCWWVPIRLYQCGEEFLNIILQSACMIWTQGRDGAPRKRVFNRIAKKQQTFIQRLFILPNTRFLIRMRCLCRVKARPFNGRNLGSLLLRLLTYLHVD